MKTTIQKAYLLLSEGKPQEAMDILQEAILGNTEVKFDHKEKDIYKAIGHPELADKAHQYAHDLFEETLENQLSKSVILEHIYKSNYPLICQLEIALHYGRHYGEMEMEAEIKEKLTKMMMIAGGDTGKVAQALAKAMKNASSEDELV